MVNTSKFVLCKAPWDGEDAPDSRATSEDTGEVVWLIPVKLVLR